MMAQVYSFPSRKPHASTRLMKANPRSAGVEGIRREWGLF